jgi:alpha-galactosidase
MWPSFGLIHGSRSSAGIKRAWTTFEHVARQNLSRNWQNGRLWWNDPDAVVLTGNLPDDEFPFHATAVYASGAMVLSSDDLTKIAPDRLAMLRKLLPHTGVAAEFADDSLRVGVIKLPDRQMICMFNWDAVPRSASVSLPKEVHVTDYWSGENLGPRKGTFVIHDMPPH